MPGFTPRFVTALLVGIAAALLPLLIALGAGTTVQADPDHAPLAEAIFPIAPLPHPVTTEALDLEALSVITPTPEPPPPPPVVVIPTAAPTRVVAAVRAATAAPAVTAAPEPVVHADRVPDGSQLYSVLLAAFGPARVDTAVRVALCEGGGNPAINTGNGYFGTFQFLPSTWAANGGSGLPSDASLAEQARVAAYLQQQVGWSPWPGVANNYGGRACG